MKGYFLRSGSKDMPRYSVLSSSLCYSSCQWTKLDQDKHFGKEAQILFFAGIDSWLWNSLEVRTSWVPFVLSWLMKTLMALFTMCASGLKWGCRREDKQGRKGRKTWQIEKGQLRQELGAPCPPLFSAGVFLRELYAVTVLPWKYEGQGH